jgi:hypothetical protein
MAGLTEDTDLIRHAFEYIIEVYRELSEENGAPTPGTQNQAVNFILADPELRRGVEGWAAAAGADEASTVPPRRLPRDDTYRRVAEFMAGAMEQPVFRRRNRD